MPEHPAEDSPLADAQRASQAPRQPAEQDATIVEASILEVARAVGAAGAAEHAGLHDSLAAAMLGRHVAGYEIREILGRGGMGVVFKAWDPQLNRPLALKMIRSELLGELGKQRFLQEAQACSRISHPHIVTVYAVGEAEGMPFMAMELVQGHTLRHRLEHGDVDWPQKVRWAVDVLDALARLHDAGVVHRDLKPDNIMLGDDARVKLMDFGLAHLEQGPTLTVAGATLGTAAYMSPEQVMGQRVDARSDVFSMGVVLYEMLAGARPFRADNPMSVMFLIQGGEPAALDAASLKLPSALVECVQRALQKDPAARFASAGPFRDALRTVLAEQPADQVPMRRRPGLALAGLLTLVLMAVVTLVIVFGRSDRAPPRDRDRAVHLNELGQDAEAAERIDEARGSYRQAILADPTYAVAWNNLAMLALGAGDEAEADSLLDRALAIDSAYAPAWFNRADLHERRGQLDDAERSYRQALQADPRFAAAYNNLGGLLLERGRTEAARLLLDEGLTRVTPEDPLRPDVLRQRGKVAWAEGQREEARSLWEAALQMRPDDTRLQELLDEARAGAPPPTRP